MDKAKNCSAQFNPVLNVNITGSGKVTGPGIDCGADCSEALNGLVSLTAIPAANYRFTGWSGDCTGTSATASVTLDVPKSCGASFARLYTLTLTKPDAGNSITTADGVSCGDVCTASYVANTTALLTANAALGYQFVSWAGNCSGTNPTTSLTLDGDKACGAVFAKVQYTLQVVVTGGSGTVMTTGIQCATGNTDCTKSYDAGTALTLTANPTNVVWGGDCSGSNTLVMDKNKVCVASFGAGTRLEVVNLGHGRVTSTGIECGLDCTETYAATTTATLTAIPDADYQFKEWTGSCSGTTPSITVTVDADTAKVCVAAFEPLVYPVKVVRVNPGTVISDKPGINCGDVCEASYAAGETVTLTATSIANTGYNFIGWSGACTGTQACVVTTRQATEVVANFERAYPLDVLFAGTGRGKVVVQPTNTVCESNCTQAYAAGTSVTLIATANVGDSFKGWTRDCISTQPTCTLLLDKAKQVTAEFEGIGYNDTARSMPQVIAAGFSPAQIDFSDDRFDVVAIIRPGVNPITSVSLQDTTGGLFSIAMEPAGVLPNGDLVYKLTYTFTPGLFGSWTFNTAWGDEPGQFNIVAKDGYQKSHTFPDLMFGNYPAQTAVSNTPVPMSYNSVRRFGPQVIMAGYTPSRSDVSDEQFDIIAIVRPGQFPIARVQLKQSHNDVFQMLMSPAGKLDNGDEIYKLTFTYPRGTFAGPNGADLKYSALWGPNATQFGIEAVDTNEQNSHRFPNVEFGDFRPVM